MLTIGPRRTSTRFDLHSWPSASNIVKCNTQILNCLANFENQIRVECRSHCYGSRKRFTGIIHTGNTSNSTWTIAKANSGIRATSFNNLLRSCCKFRNLLWKNNLNLRMPQVLSSNHGIIMRRTTINLIFITFTFLCCLRCSHVYL